MTEWRDLESIFIEKRAYFVRVIARRLNDAEVAEEIVQEAFLQVAEAAKEQVINNPEGYLMRASINLSTDWLRREKSRRRREKSWANTNYALGDSGEAASTDPSPVDAIAAQDDFRRIEAALGLLSPPVRTAFTLHKIQGLSHQETAIRMGLSRSTVEKHIMKAMRRLTDALSEDSENGGAIEEANRSERQVLERSERK